MDVRGTPDAARLGRWLLAFQGIVVAGAGWWVERGDSVPLLTVVFGLAAVLAAIASAALPWSRLRPPTLTAYPLAGLLMLGVVAHVAPSVGLSFLGFLTLWFMFVGLVAPLFSAFVLLGPAVLVWVLAQGSLGPDKIVRIAINSVVWVALGNVLALQAAASRLRTDNLAHQAETDALTGLPNRRALEATLSKMMPGDVVVVVDLDHFKQVNDLGGHEFGDRVLVDFAQTLASVVRGSDLVARYGGEEFVLVLARGGVYGIGAASVLARLRGQWSMLHPDITWSAGASCHVAGEEPHATLREADRALYRAKDEGRDRVAVSSSARELVGIATPSD
ncbi:GGDEF domain-containing protein [Angustibacter sp. McL0619]|uniref:GGDEF domain-containing protein n=1 Tax=Angustibacter sp. McL0619 TaxID=3415676 RepID=UPI003CEF6273